jgi:nucleoside-diphosphate-sugar epimerase/GT2 family glycosyltransferase
MNALVVSASLVLYKPDLEVLERALRALQDAGQLAKLHYELRLEVTLVDNSNDPAVHRRVTDWMSDASYLMGDWTLRLLRAPENIGYGRGNNLVIADAQSDYHVVINPDLFVQPDAFLEALRFMITHKDVGLLSPAVFGEDGKRHYVCKRHPTLLVMFLRSFSPLWLQSRLQFIVDEFEMRDCDYEKIIDPLEYPTGSFMFFRTKPLQAIGGFDPDFFLHYEDADIGRRMLSIARVVYVPAVRVVHQWARDTHRSLRARLVTTRSGWMYWRKWGGVLDSKSGAETIQAKVQNNQSDARWKALSSGMRVLVTGANGFIGQALCADLHSRGHMVLGAVRKSFDSVHSATVKYVGVGDMDDQTDWTAALSGVDSVVHLAGRVHVMRDLASNSLDEFRRLNVALTLNLARQAAHAGVRRFIFISSIKVNGEKSPVGQPYTADDIPRPLDAYGQSKLEAERALVELAAQTGLELVIIRPVLVYGLGVKANFQTMIRWLRLGLPLPLGSLNNQRSMVALDNLTDLIFTCVHHPSAVGQVFLVSDGEDLTVTGLLKRTSAVFRRSPRLFPMPAFLLRAVGGILGQTASVQRLCDTLVVDIAKTQKLLNWGPPVSVDVALKKALQKSTNH